MSKPRLEYAYRAARLDTSNRQNLGDFQITYWGEAQGRHCSYHYASEDFPHRAGEIPSHRRLINRNELIPISRGSRIWDECMKAIDRLRAEEQEQT